jgi:hypothetical protein
MAAMSRRDVEHVFESLRKGLVPERGLDTFAVGVERQRGELHRQLELAASNEGTIKFLRGDYGCGKTFMARLMLLDAQARSFATSFVVVSDNDLRFHRFDDVYRKVVTELGTSSCPRGALGDVLDRWIARVEEGLIAAGADEDAPDFDEVVRRRLDEDLASLTGGKAPPDFVRVIQTIFDLKQEGELSDAGALLSWLSGSGNVSASVKRRAGIKGDIGSRDAMDYLRGILEIVKAAGYAGLVIVIDEAETILRMRKDTRHKSLNGIRQISDAAGAYPGLLWVFTGTPDFYDSRQGVAGLAPLHDRVRFLERNGRASLRQAQLNLVPFKAERLKSVALRLRELYPASDRASLEERIDSMFIEQLIQEVTAGFKGVVGIVPRQFLREFVEQMDLVEEDPDYQPYSEYGFSLDAADTEERSRMHLSDVEQAALTGVGKAPVDDDDEGFVPALDSW